MGGVWQQLLPSGRVSGRNGLGPFVIGDRKRMEAIVAASLKRAGVTELVVDYDHQSDYGAVPEVGGVAPAAGWIRELQVRDDGIWGRIEWTERATASIRANEYRYISPVFQYDEKTGQVFAILRAGLTNSPNFDLTEVAASAHNSHTRNKTMDEILAALGLAAGSGESEVLSAINAMLDNSTAIASAVGLDKGAKPADILTAVNSAVAAQTALGTVAASVKAEKDAAPDDIVTAVNSAIADPSGEVDPSKYVPIAQFNELSKEVGKLRGTMDGDKATAAVEAAMSAGKVAPASKDWAMSYAKKDLADFETYVASAPVICDPQLNTTKKPAADPAATTEADTAVMSALGVSKEDFEAARKLETA